MSQFNFSMLNQYIPMMNEFDAYLITNYEDSGLIEAPLKLKEDGYNTLFLFNVVPLFTCIATAYATFIISTLLTKVSLYFSSTLSIRDKIGFSLSLAIFKIKFLRILCAILTQYCDSFFYSGLLRAFISFGYDLNLGVFMELNNSHFTHPDWLLKFSSISALVMLIFEFYVLKLVVKYIHIKSLYQR
jgi:hypothetical protein